MGRPFLALALVATAALLLGSLFTEMEGQIEDPDPYTPDAETAQAVAEAAAAHPEYLETAADAGLFRLLEDAEITIPPGGAEIDGDLIRLLQDMQWTLPPGTEVSDLTLPLPPGTSFDVPDGTRVDGDTLIFPAGSELVLDDGTTLRLPEGGTLRVPGADPETLQAMIDNGRFTVPESGSIFHAPEVQNQGAWDVTLPRGTSFQAPDGWTPPADFEDGGSFTLPAGHELDPQGTGSGTQSEGSKGAAGLFDKIGNVDLTPKTNKEGGGSNLPTLPGASAALWWALAVVAVVAVGILTWRHRAHLRGLLPARAAAAFGAAPVRHPYRLVTQIDGRPEHLPLAVAPGTARRALLRIERRDTEDGGAGWAPQAAQATIRLGADVLHDGPVSTTGVSLELPALPNGDHTIEVRLRIPSRRDVTLDLLLRVAPWAEQTARDYDRLAAAVHAASPLPDGFTARILERHAAVHLPVAAHAPLSAALGVFERANYSTRDIEEADWIQAADTIERLLPRLRPREAAAPAASRKTVTFQPDE